MLVIRWQKTCKHVNMTENQKVIPVWNSGKYSPYLVVGILTLKEQIDLQSVCAISSPN